MTALRQANYFSTIVFKTSIAIRVNLQFCPSLRSIVMAIKFSWHSSMGIKIARIICKSYANLSGNLWLHYRSNPLKPFHRNIPLNPIMYIMFMLAGTYHENSSRGSPVSTKATTFPLVTNDRHCSFRILLYLFQLFFHRFLHHTYLKEESPFVRTRSHHW